MSAVTDSTRYGEAARLARLHLDEFRDEILQGVKRRIRECLGPQPATIARYYRAYVRTFQQPFEPCRLAEVVRQAGNARIVYVGDFHTNVEAQRAERDLLEKLLAAGRRVVLAVEMFAAEDQGLVDRFVGDELDERRFLHAIRYNQTWGFRWANYRPLLALARARQLKVVALNLKRNASLKERDQFAATRIGQVLSEDPERLVFVVVGDLHLAPAHLPAEVDRVAGEAARPRLIIYQNSETIDWRLRADPDADRIEAVRLGPDACCLRNTPTLVKMQGFLSWLENSEQLLDRTTSEIRVPEEAGGELEDEFEELVEEIADFFGLSPPEPGSWDLEALGDVGFLERMSDSPDANAVARLVRDRRPCVVSEPLLVYLPDTDLVTTATGAMALLLRTSSGDERQGVRSRGAFYRRVIDRALEFFAGKLVHPALRGTRLVDLLRLRESTGRLPRKLARRRAVARFLPAWIEAVQSGLEPDPEREETLRRADPRLVYDLSRAAGEWLGEGLFDGHRRGRLVLGELRDAILERWQEPAARAQVLEWGARVGTTH